MKSIIKKLMDVLRFLCRNIVYSFVYPLTQKIIGYFFDRPSFRRYLFSKDSFSDMANRVMGITGDGRVRIDHLEVDIVKGCNLKCKFCSHVSPLRKGYVPLEQLSEWFETWSKKVIPNQFVILGGEPLLHPEVEKVILTAGKYWKDSQIQFVTNGLLLPKKSQTVFDALHAVNAKVYVSKHFDDPEFNLKFQESLDCLVKTGLTFCVRPAYKQWARVYRID
ncbi:MAG: radical SAM protein, partial [Planctomycetaceae bacterium]|nr:radical SAM protein [Planctomycetaceae bacterium]